MDGKKKHQNNLYGYVWQDCVLKAQKISPQKRKRRKKVKIEDDITNKVPNNNNSNVLHINKPLTCHAVRKSKVCMKHAILLLLFFGCKKNNLDNASFCRITCVHDYMVIESDRIRQHMTYHLKKYMKGGNNYPDVVLVVTIIVSQQKFEKKKKTIIINIGGKKRDIHLELVAPKADTPTSLLRT